MTLIVCIALLAALWALAMTLWILDAPSPRQTVDALLTSGRLDENLHASQPTASGAAVTVQPVDSGLRVVA